MLFLKKLLLVLALAYLLVCLLMFFAQRKLLYFPGPAPLVEPERHGAAWSRVTLETADSERLCAWFAEAPDARGAVLLSHGNAGNVESRVPLAEAFVNAGLSVLLYDYRGYGGSTGSPSEAGLALDARAAYGWLRARGVEPARIVLYGESLGGGVTTGLAVEVECAAVILDHTFSSVPDLASELYPWLPVRWLARDRFDNLARVPRLEAPLLLIHSPDDELIPFEHARRLQRAARPGTVLLETSGGHNGAGFLGDARFEAAVRGFLDDALEAA